MVFCRKRNLYLDKLSNRARRSVIRRQTFGHRSVWKSETWPHTVLAVDTPSCQRTSSRQLSVSPAWRHLCSTVLPVERRGRSDRAARPLPSADSPPSAARTRPVVVKQSLVVVVSEVKQFSRHRLLVVVVVAVVWPSFVDVQLNSRQSGCLFFRAW